MHVQENDPSLKSTINTVSYLARFFKIDRLVGLDDYDVEVAAALREHLRLPGMGESRARFFRDKLACRIEARRLGIPVPDFTPVFNNAEVAEFIARVPPPWMLKPRSEASATGINKVHSADELWRLLDSKGDKRCHFLLERYLPGDVHHVDSLTSEGRVLFAETHRCLTPPFNVAHGGGIFATVTMPRGSQDEKDLRALNERVLTGLGMWRGASHVEYIKSREDGRFYLLETAARVGGAHIAEQVEASTGVNLWEEWANLEYDAGTVPYTPPVRRHEHAGLLMTLARTEHPNLSCFNDPEVCFTAPEPWHVGLIVHSPSHERVLELVEQYQRRLRSDFCAVIPSADKPSN
jgi:biotin carboxylase